MIAGTVFAFLLVLSVATIGAADAQTSTANPAPDLGSVTSLYLAGYSGNVSAGTTFTSLDALWNVPAVTCQPKLGGAQQVITMMEANRLVVGIQVLCKQGSSQPTMTPFAYFPPVNSKPVHLKLNVKAGDLIFGVFLINPSTNTVNATLRDASTNTGVHYIKVVPGAAATAEGFIFGVSRGGSGLFTTKDLAKFGSPITFEGCSFDTSSIASAAFLNSITMHDASNKVMASTSSLTGGGATFTVTWVRST
jgi:hypothetical protein